MLNINNELLKIIKKRNLSKLLKDFAENKTFKACILIHKDIALQDFRDYLSSLLNKDVNVGIIEGVDKYYYISSANSYIGFGRQGMNFQLAPIDECFLKEEYIYKIDSMNDLTEIEASNNRTRISMSPEGHLSFDRMPGNPGFPGYVTLGLDDSPWDRNSTFIQPNRNLYNTRTLRVEPSISVTAHTTRNDRE